MPQEIIELKRRAFELRERTRQLADWPALDEKIRQARAECAAAVREAEIELQKENAHGHG